MANRQTQRQRLAELEDLNRHLQEQLDQRDQRHLQRSPQRQAEPQRHLQQQPHVSINQPPEFDYDIDATTDQGAKWSSWIRRFDIWMEASGLNDAPEKRKIALLLSTAGEKIDEIFHSNVANAVTLADVKTGIKDFLVPKKDAMFTTIQFRTMKQNSNEPMDEFVKRLRLKAADCDFGEHTDREIYMMVMAHGTSNEVREAALRGTTQATPWDLPTLLRFARTHEATRAQSQQLASMTAHPQQSTNHTRHNPKQRALRKEHKSAFEERQRSTAGTSIPHRSTEKTCANCGYEHADRPCPAKDKACKHCGKLNHFVSVCRSKLAGKPPTRGLNQTRQSYKKHQTHHTREEKPQAATSDSDQSFAIRSIAPGRLPRINLILNGTVLKFLVDTGSSVNTIDEATYRALQPRPLLTPHSNPIVGYPSVPLKILGKFHTKLATRSTSTTTQIVVVSGQAENLLSCATSIELQLVSLNQQLSIASVSKRGPDYTTPGWVTTTADLDLKYPNLFKSGIGKVSDTKIKLTIDDTITPIAQKPRHTPYHLREKIEAKLDLLLKNEVIRRAEGPTRWLSSIVPILKENGDIRLTIDSRSANTAIQRTRHPMPTPEDISIMVNGATHFTKLDIREAFHIFELAEESKHITAFRTHMGNFEYNRLNMGINAATEIFQCEMENILKGLNKTFNLVDDILIWGTGQLDHDKNLHDALQILNNRGITLNQAKCQFSQSRMKFFGLELSNEGVRVQDSKVEALLETPSPKTVKDIQSFMGLAQFVSKQIPNMAATAKPMTELVKKANKCKWEWCEVQQLSFERLKSSIVNKAMGHFNKSWDTHLTVDASPDGLGAILWQSNPKNSKETKIISFASRKLTDTEARYSQVEKEGLAAAWACEKFAVYLIGHSFTLITDNKGIELIFRNANSRPPPRIQRLRLRLDQFNFRIVHKPGATNISDYLSRHPTGHADVLRSSLADQHATHVVNSLVPKAMTLENIDTATSADETLQKLTRCIISGHKSRAKELAPFMKVFDLLAIHPGKNVITVSNKIVIPASLTQEVVELAHAGHQGLGKTKKLLRSKVWFPGIDRLTQAVVGKCKECAATANSSPPEPLQPTEMPSVWHTVALDHKGPLPNGKHLLIMVDVASRFAVVHEVKSTSFENNRDHLESTWTMLGAPVEVVSDNGPPFSGGNFKLHCEQFGIKHRKVTPAWPRANGSAERFIRNLVKQISIATTSKRPAKPLIDEYTRAYNSTPHSSTDAAPTSLMFHRHANTSKLPSLPNNTDCDRHNKAYSQDKLHKAIAKHHYDRRNHATPTQIRVGDQVMLDTRAGLKIFNKATPRFDPQPYTVTRKKGSMITVVRGKQSLTRNVSLFKKFQ